MSATNRFNLDDFPLWTALITPFTNNGDVDYDDLSTLLKAQEQAKNGILMLGSTGEALNIALETKQQIIRFCCEQELSVPLMVGVGGSMLQDTLDWINWLNDMPVDTLLTVTPLYAKPGYYGQTAWFKSLLDAADVPCVLYNVPGRTAVSLDFNTVNDLLHHENFYGIKEASGDVDSFKAYCRAAPGKFMFCGDDALMPEFTRAGAQGLISVVANVWPRATHLYVQQNLNSTFLDISVWRKACNTMMCVSNPIPVKRLLNAKEVISSAFLQPPLHANDMLEVMPLIQQDQAIKDWYMQNTKFSKRIS